MPEGVYFVKGEVYLVSELTVGTVGQLPEPQCQPGADGEVLLAQRLLHHLLVQKPSPPLVDPHLEAQNRVVDPNTFNLDPDPG